MAQSTLSSIRWRRVDGDIELFKHNWGQVSIIFFKRYIATERDPETGKILSESPDYTRNHLPVHTLKYIMMSLGHSHVDVLKLDMEVASMRSLESATDSMGSCLPVEQISSEFHFHTFDNRYLGGEFT